MGEWNQRFWELDKIYEVEDSTVEERRTEVVHLPTQDLPTIVREAKKTIKIRLRRQKLCNSLPNLHGIQHTT